jgi:hypothetical protein
MRSEAGGGGLVVLARAINKAVTAEDRLIQFNTRATAV